MPWIQQCTEISGTFHLFFAHPYSAPSPAPWPTHTLCQNTASQSDAITDLARSQVFWNRLKISPSWAARVCIVPDISLALAVLHSLLNAFTPGETHKRSTFPSACPNVLASSIPADPKASLEITLLQLATTHWRACTADFSEVGISFKQTKWSSNRNHRYFLRHVAEHTWWGNRC